MKKTVSIIIASVLAVSIISCGQSEKEKQEKEEQQAAIKTLGGALGGLMKAGTEMAKSAKESESKMKERRAKGDTLAMHYTELQKYLPTISGYTMGEPDGGSVNMTGMSYSNAEGKYKNEKGKRVKVSIIDYNQAYALYLTATAMWAMGLSVDSPSEKACGFKIDETTGGWESFKKKSKRAEVTLGIGDRFWIHVEAEDQENTDFVKEIAKSIDLSKLSAI